MRKLFSVALAIALAISMLFPSRAEAMAHKFKNCPSVTKGNITYLLYHSTAIVTKSTGKNIVIPVRFKHKGKTYTVRAIWDGALSRNKSLRRIDLQAYLECCEDDSLFIKDARKIRIIVHRRSDYEWIRYGEPCCNSLVTLKK